MSQLAWIERQQDVLPGGTQETPGWVPHYTGHTHRVTFNICHWFITEKNQTYVSKLFYTHVNIH